MRVYRNNDTEQSFKDIETETIVTNSTEGKKRFFNKLKPSIVNGSKTL